jgi:glycosidase
MGSQLGFDLVECLNMILLMLPGTAVTYSGEKLGMENAPVIWGVVRESATPEHSHKKNSGKRH